MEKELVELYEAAKKAADAAISGDGKHEESRCIDALEQLKKFPVNYKILVNTQVIFLSFFFILNHLFYFCFNLICLFPHFISEQMEPPLSPPDRSRTWI